MSNSVKHNVSLPADFVRELRKRSLDRSASTYGVVQAFLRRAVALGMQDWWNRQETGEGGLPSGYVHSMDWVEVPAKEVRTYENLVRYLETPARSAEEREWKRAVKRVADSYGEPRMRAINGAVYSIHAGFV